MEAARKVYNTELGSVVIRDIIAKHNITTDGRIGKHDVAGFLMTLMLKGYAEEKLDAIQVLRLRVELMTPVTVNTVELGSMYRNVSKTEEGALLLAALLNISGVFRAYKQSEGISEERWLGRVLVGEYIIKKLMIFS